jgi:GNAT superfamily N-acetyltransferase
MSFDLSESIACTTSGAHSNAALPACVRALTENHRSELEGLLTALDRDSRCSRFGYAASDAALIAHSRSALQTASGAIGIFVADKLAGVAEIYRCDKTDNYEVSLVVDRPLRKRGLGWNLLHSSVQWARSADAESLRLIFSRHNWAMRKLATRAQAKLDLSLDELNAEIRLGPNSH